MTVFEWLYLDERGVTYDFALEEGVVKVIEVHGDVVGGH